MTDEQIQAAAFSIWEGADALEGVGDESYIADRLKAYPPWERDDIYMEVARLFR